MRRLYIFAVIIVLSITAGLFAKDYYFLKEVCSTSVELLKTVKQPVNNFRKINDIISVRIDEFVTAAGSRTEDK